MPPPLDFLPAFALRGFLDPVSLLAQKDIELSATEKVAAVAMPGSATAPAKASTELASSVRRDNDIKKILVL
jgi:hypothetical protein